MRARALLPCLVVLAGCTTRLGDAPLLARDPDLVGTKLLRPGAVGRSCHTTVLGLATGAGAGTLDEAMAAILSQDDEGNVVSAASVSEERVTTGVFNRHCVVVRGDLGRTVTTLTLPAPAGHHHGHGTE